jgi:mono/diheme cytochrome c family protein
MKNIRNAIILSAILSVFYLFFVAGSSAFALSGKALFKSAGCISCHTINGVGGKIGPNLSKIGSKRSITWLRSFIYNPSKYFAPGSSVTLNGKTYTVIMPPFSRTLSKAKRDVLTTYLESLK